QNGTLDLWSTRRHAPEPLRAIGFDAHDRDARAVGHDRRGVLALGGLRHAGHGARGDVISIDVGLRSRLGPESRRWSADGCKENRAVVRREERLIVVPGTVRDV